MVYLLQPLPNQGKPQPSATLSTLKLYNRKRQSPPPTARWTAFRARGCTSLKPKATCILHNKLLIHIQNYSIAALRKLVTTQQTTLMHPHWLYHTSTVWVHTHTHTHTPVWLWILASCYSLYVPEVIFKTGSHGSTITTTSQMKVQCIPVHTVL